MSETVREQVVRGAAWLDREYGSDWPLDVDLSALEMGSCERCVVGQLFGHFHYAVERIGYSEALGLEDYGFDSTESYVPLVEAWTELVKERLNAGVSV